MEVNEISLLDESLKLIIEPVALVRAQQATPADWLMAVGSLVAGGAAIGAVFYAAKELQSYKRRRAAEASEKAYIAALDYLDWIRSKLLWRFDFDIATQTGLLQGYIDAYFDEILRLFYYPQPPRQEFRAAMRLAMLHLNDEDPRLAALNAVADLNDRCFKAHSEFKLKLDDVLAAEQEAAATPFLQMNIGAHGKIPDDQWDEIDVFDEMTATIKKLWLAFHPEQAGGEPPGLTRQIGR